MAIKIYKPYTPTTRNKSSLDFSILTKIKPERSLTVSNHRAKGRNNQGRITTRHKGGGHNIELFPGKGGQLVRAAGTSAKILAKENNFVVLRLSSKEIRLFKKECFATIGRVSNSDFYNVVSGKAGRSRWLGIRPTVRGSVMNPVDHPHGGGEGRCPIGKPRPLTPWGKPALGIKTRKRKNKSDIFIIRSRS